MKKMSSLESHLGFWLRFVSNHVSSSFEKKLKECDIGLAEWVVLRSLYDQKLSPSNLAERIGITRGAMSKLLNRLVNKQLVEREESIKDRRFQTVALSETGKHLLPKLAFFADLNDQQFFGHLSEERKEQLFKILKEIVSAKELSTIPIN